MCSIVYACKTIIYQLNYKDMETKVITLYKIVDSKGKQIEGNLESRTKAEQMIALFELLDKRENRYIKDFYSIQQQ